MNTMTSVNTITTVNTITSVNTMAFHNDSSNPEQFIQTASQIFNRLAEQNITDPDDLDQEIPHYIAAKHVFISIAEKCLHEGKSVMNHFEIEIRARHMSGAINSPTFTVLWWHMNVILDHYEQCSKHKHLQSKHKENTIKEKVISQAALATEIECAICLTPHKKHDTLCVQSCQHEFGKTCLLEWQHVSKQCPLCRSDAKKIHGYKARAKKNSSQGKEEN